MELLKAIWLMLPAYFSNASPVAIKGKMPIDFGRNFIDGKRIFGDGKTFRGFFGGAAVGMAVGCVQDTLIWVWGFYNPLQIPIPPYIPPSSLICMCFGALVGDLIKSFAKRRMGIKRGAPLPIADQLDFVLGAWLFLYIFTPAWFLATFTPTIILIVLIVTPLLHLATNSLGYLLGMKDVWW